MQKKSVNLLWSIVIIVVVVVALVLLGRHTTNKVVPAPATTLDATASLALPGLQTTQAPWDASVPDLRARLKAINLPALSEEGTVLHIHQHLDIYIDGQQVAVTPGIGINKAAGFISPLHVHDDTNVIHVESPTVQTFTLGQFFDVWGVKFTSSCIGGYCADATKTLKIFVNGQPYTGDPRELALEAHQEIVVAYGTDKELPSPIPSSYVFAAGE